MWDDQSEMKGATSLCFNIHLQWALDNVQSWETERDTIRKAQGKEMIT